MTIHRIVGIVSALALLALIMGIIQQRPASGDHREPLWLAGGVRATLYYRDPPGAPPVRMPGVDGPAPGSGNHAGVVVAHGFAADRSTMEAVAESLANAGYTVVSLDLTGHGLNRYPVSVGGGEQMADDIRIGVQYLHETMGFEFSKIAALGHSMGAKAVLEYGSRSAGLGGLVMLGGATQLLGPEPPRNTLFLYAERDLPGIEAGVRITAARLAHVGKVEERRTYGDFTAGTAVRIAQIPGVSHGPLVNSPVAFTEAVDWLDQATGFPARAAPPAFLKHPLGSPLIWWSFLLVLPGLGLLLARLAPDTPAAGTQARWVDLGALPVALLMPLPFLVLGRPGVLMGLSLADLNVTHLALAGVLLVAGLFALGRFRPAFARWPTALAVAAAGWLAVSVLYGPVGAYFHGVGLTPEKARLAAWSALCLAPFALAMQWLLYRPQWWRGTALRLAARIGVFACVGLGLALGVYGAAGLIAIVVLMAAFVTVEPVLAGFYARSRNILVAAGFDAIVTGWLFALFLPTTF